MTVINITQDNNQKKKSYKLPTIMIDILVSYTKIDNNNKMKINKENQL